jgi:histidinol-phosphate phosphatase family protein
VTARRPAVFLDRDGTVIRDAIYIKDPRQVELLPGVPEGLQRLHAAGFALVVITNQSGIARGMLTEEDYAAVRDRLGALLTPYGIQFTASYHCPHHPEVDGPCDCRKPGTGLYRRAADEHGLDPVRSFAIGDRWRDIAPAIALGGQGILVPIESTPAADVAEALTGAVIAQDFTRAVSLVLAAAKG